MVGVPVVAHGDRLAASCEGCFRCSPPLDADRKTAERILKGLGWEVHPEMRCPICVGRRSAKILVRRDEREDED
jgi:hypothetical protein